MMRNYNIASHLLNVKVRKVMDLGFLVIPLANKRGTLMCDYFSPNANLVYLFLTNIYF